MKFLHNPYVRVLTLVLLLQGSIFYALAMRAESTPPMQPLSTFPISLPNWAMVRDVATPKEVLDILKADDTLTREYVGVARTPLCRPLSMCSFTRWR